MSEEIEMRVMPETVKPPPPANDGGAPMSVDEHAAQLKPREMWRHAGASALHGWAEHAHHEGEPMQLSAEDYAAALEAAEQSNPKPHGPALSRHCPFSFEE